MFNQINLSNKVIKYFEKFHVLLSYYSNISDIFKKPRSDL